jgi:hypothetical protein
MDGEQLERLLERRGEIVASLQAKYRFPDSDVDDLLQEMALRFLEMPEGHTDSFCLTQGFWTAVDWLRRMHRTRSERRTVPSSEARRLADSPRAIRVWH